MDGNFQKAHSYTGYVLVNTTGSVIQAFLSEQICQEIQNRVDRETTVNIETCFGCNQIGCNIRWRAQMIFPQFCHDSSDNSS